MQLGFLSLLLAVIQRPISKICIPNRITNSMLPCNRVLLDSTKTIKERELASVQNSQDHCASRVCHTFQILKVKTKKKKNYDFSYLCSFKYF